MKLIVIIVYTMHLLRKKKPRFLCMCDCSRVPCSLLYLEHIFGVVYMYTSYDSWYFISFFFFLPSFFILRRMGQIKAQAHHTSTYYHTHLISMSAFLAYFMIRYRLQYVVGALLHRARKRPAVTDLLALSHNLNVYQLPAADAAAFVHVIHAHNGDTPSLVLRIYDTAVYYIIPDA